MMISSSDSSMPRLYPRWRAKNGLLAQVRPQPAGVIERKSLPVVVRIYEHLRLAAPGGDPALPGLELCARVVAATPARAVVQADEGPVGGQLVALKRTLGVIADHQRRSVRAQQVHDL